MKILFTVESYYPKMSGVPVVTKYLAEGLSNKGHEVHIVTGWIDGCREEDFLNGVFIHRFHIVHNFIKKPSGDIKKYRKFIFESGFDAIVCECAQCVTTDAILPCLKEYSGKKILHSHGFSGMLLKPFKKFSSFRNTVANTVNYFNWKYYYGVWLKKYIPAFDVILCLSEVDSSKEYLDKYGDSNVFVLSNAAEDMFFFDDISSEAINKYVDLNGKDYFVSVANYCEYKNQMGILKAFYELKNIDCSMVFVGSSRNKYYDDLVELKKQMDALFGYREVHFLTGVNRQDIPGIIKGALLYLVGSTFEEFSISLIESMALGIPFISTNVGNARLLPGGITIDTITDMSDTINRILNDNELYTHLSSEGQKYASLHCRISSVVNQMEYYLLNDKWGGENDCT